MNTGIYNKRHAYSFILGSIRYKSYIQKYNYNGTKDKRLISALVPIFTLKQLIGSLVTR